MSVSVWKTLLFERLESNVTLVSVDYFDPISSEV